LLRGDILTQVIDQYRNKILQGDCLSHLKTLPDNSIQMCVTSPPYYNLRDYGTAKWDGGNPECDHLRPVSLRRNSKGGFQNSDGTRGNQRNNIAVQKQYERECKKCGAIRVDNQIGIEETPYEYVRKMVEIFHEVYRVLRPDGILWLNLGDSYAANRTYQVPQTKDVGTKRADESFNHREMKVPEGLKPKDLIGVPWRVAFALQADGWYLRSDVVWQKPNCIPESVTDRPTKSHEFFFLLTKKPKYFYDAYAIKEPVLEGSLDRAVRGVSNKHKNINGAPGQTPHTMNAPREHGEGYPASALRNKRDVWDDDEEIDTLSDWLISRIDTIDPTLSEALLTEYINELKNKTDVWNVVVKGTKDAHFATFSTELITPCILSGTSEKGACPSCGAPYRRIVEKGDPIKEWKDKCGADSKGNYNGVSEKYLKQDALGKATYTGFNARWKAKQQNASDVKRRILEGMVERKTTAWEPTCECFGKFIKYKSMVTTFCKDDDGNDILEEKQFTRYEPSGTPPITRPCIVLDPFMGSGTTAIVSKNNGLDYIGIELNPDYIALAERLISDSKGNNKKLSEF
jgi:DNA modification methylase